MKKPIYPFIRSGVVIIILGSLILTIGACNSQLQSLLQASEDNIADEGVDDLEELLANTSVKEAEEEKIREECLQAKKQINDLLEGIDKKSIKEREKAVKDALGLVLELNYVDDKEVIVPVLVFLTRYIGDVTDDLLKVKLLLRDPNDIIAYMTALIETEIKARYAKTIWCLQASSEFHPYVDHGGRGDFNQALEKYLLGLAQNSLDSNCLKYFIALKDEIELPVGLLGKVQMVLFKVYNKSKDKPEVINTVKFIKAVEKFFEGSIAITYRDEGGGKGALYDHYTLQLSTDHPTVIALDEEGNAGNLNQDLIKTFIRDKWTFGLSYGIDKDGKRIPDATTRPWEQGLLVVPGRERKQEGNEARNEYEQKILKEALKRGQPILAICAGCWQLWKAFDGEFEGVKDHVIRPMINLSENTGQVTYNTQIHRISIEQQSLLFQAMRKPKNLFLPVNSVHWKAPKVNQVRGVTDKFKVAAEDKFKVSATAKHDEGLAPFRNIKENQKMNVQENTIEAFECENGTPILGIQWHPEAYATDSEAEITEAQGANLALLRYMAKAGDAYYQKIQMLAELKHKCLQKLKQKFRQVEQTSQVTEN